MKFHPGETGDFRRHRKGLHASGEAAAAFFFYNDSSSRLQSQDDFAGEIGDFAAPAAYAGAVNSILT